MPTLYELLGYNVFFWSNEGMPLEPVHVHVAHKPSKNATKFWIHEDGDVSLANNNSNLSSKDISRLQELLKDYSSEIIKQWTEFFKTEPVFKNK